MKKIKPVKNLDATIRIPGSKSYTHRALIISSLADGESTLIDPLKCEDTFYTSNALIKFGAPIFWDENEVFVCGGNLSVPTEKIFVGNSGTTLRFLVALSSLLKGKVILEASERMKDRPINALIECLKCLSANLKEEDNSLLIYLESKGLEGGLIRISGKESSQFISALLMISPYARERMEIEVVEDLVSKPYVDITLDTMSAFGVNVKREGYKYFIISNEKGYKPQKYQIESDASSASYFFSASAITGGRIRVEKFNPRSLQGDIRFLTILEEMGAKVIQGEDWVEVRGREIRGIEIDMSEIPDIVPTLGVTASFAQGKTIIKNIGHLRFKESDRIIALAKELVKIGVHVEVGSDWLCIEGGKPHGAEIETYNDHRIAMSFAIAGLKVPGIKIMGEDCVRKSFPKFWETFKSLYKKS